MTFLFGGHKSPKAPAVPPPPPTPDVGPQVEDQAGLAAKRRAGYQKTILAGNLEPADTGKKRLLG